MSLCPSTCPLKFVLINPQIPWNTGAIGRTSVALGAELIVVDSKLDLSNDAAVKRAGLDYWEFVKRREYKSWDEFLVQENPLPEQMFFFSTKARKIYYEAKFMRGCYLIFGSETAGLPENIHKKYSEQFFKLPMYSDKIRSLNLANSATAVAYEAIRQIEFM